MLSRFSNVTQRSTIWIREILKCRVVSPTWQIAIQRAWQLDDVRWTALGQEISSLVRTGQQGTRQRRISPQQRQMMLLKGKATGLGKREIFPEEAPAPPVPRYEGTDTACSICQQEFQRTEMCLRLVCNHLFHKLCWDTYQHTFDAVSHECPNCRGPGTAKACFRHLGASNPNEVRPRRRNHSRGGTASDRPRFLPGATPTSSESSFVEVQEDVQHVL